MTERTFSNFSLLVLIVFYGTYVLKMLLQKRKGIRTDQMGRGKQGKAKAIEIGLKLITYIIPVIEFLSIIGERTMLPSYMRTIGILIALSGDVIFVVSVVSMRDSWRAGVSEEEKTELVTEGIYSFSRNPAFLGFDLVYIGLLLVYFNWILLVSSMVSIIMFHLQITKVEEPFLKKIFGKPYEEYLEHTSRYLGRKRP